ncbi:MAG: cysteine desulfurase family protein [Ilumatobacteraceae bacterium]
MADPLVYLDHAATTPMRPEAVEAMLPFLSERFANPSGSHRFARSVRQVVDECRDVVADALGCTPGEIVFTGCGTESDNAAIAGTQQRQGGIGVCPAVEHHAVLHATLHGGGRIVAVDNAARVDLVALAATLDNIAAAGGTVSIVSVMAVNNEVGSITSLPDVAAVVRRHAPTARVLTDAVQAPCWIDLRTLTPHVDLLALSAHKFGGPKGVGLLMARQGTVLEPLLQGGGQERDRRSGTHNVAGIVAMTEALRLTDMERVADNLRIETLRNHLVDSVLAELDDVIETVARDAKVVGSAHICIAGIESESLLFLLDEANVCASAASACASGAMEPSHVLAAMGVDRRHSLGALRMTLGSTTTEDDIDRAIDVVVGAVQRLRAPRPGHAAATTQSGAST